MKTISLTTKRRRNAMYAAACKDCASFKEPSRRQITPHDVMWLHDGITPCGAADLREKNFQRDSR